MTIKIVKRFRDKEDSDKLHMPGSIVSFSKAKSNKLIDLGIATEVKSETKNGAPKKIEKK